MPKEEAKIHGTNGGDHTRETQPNDYDLCQSVLPPRQDPSDYRGFALLVLKDQHEALQDPHFAAKPAAQTALTDIADTLVSEKLIDESALSNGRCTAIIYQVLSDHQDIRKDYVAELTRIGATQYQSLQDLVEFGYTSELLSDTDLLREAIKGEHLTADFKGDLLNAVVSQTARLADGLRTEKQETMAQVMSLAVEHCGLDQLSGASRHSIRCTFNLADVKCSNSENAHIPAWKKAEKGLQHLETLMEPAEHNQVKNWLLAFPKKAFSGSDGMDLEQQRPHLLGVCRKLDSMQFGAINGQIVGAIAILNQNEDYRKLHALFQRKIEERIGLGDAPPQISRALKEELRVREKGAHAENIAANLFALHPEVSSVVSSRSFSAPDKVGCDFRVELMNGLVLHVDIKSSQHGKDEREQARQNFLQKNGLRTPLAITTSRSCFQIHAASECLVIDPIKSAEVQEANEKRVDEFIRSHMYEAKSSNLLS